MLNSFISNSDSKLTLVFISKWPCEIQEMLKRVANEEPDGRRKSVCACVGGGGGGRWVTQVTKMTLVYSG